MDIIVGTAGHIDHGKTALVRALTGVDADRLPEEKKRGITIDLGFAELDLDDVRIGFVDVPGHEKFVKNMLAGVHGIDLVALVIAADEGVMPQTREHFAICRLLEIKTGLIILTKKDLVDDELLELVKLDVADLVAGSFLEAAPVCAVSARTGEGIDDLKQALKKIASDIPARESKTIARLPIDRSFTMKGFGAVVTGTLVAGEISEGTEMELLPLGKKVRIRGVQTYGKSVATARSGQRTALNLGGIDHSEVERGQMLASSGLLRPTQIINAEIEVLADSAKSIKSGQRIRIHKGTVEALARIYVIGAANQIMPGERGFAQIRIENPIVALPGERFIIRGYSPQITIAGGRVIDGIAPKHKSKDYEVIATRLGKLMESQVAEERPTELAIFLEMAAESGLTFADLQARTGWIDNILKDVITETLDKQMALEAEERYISRTHFENLSQRTVDTISSHHNAEPLSRGMLRETLREKVFAKIPLEIFRKTLSILSERVVIEAEKDVVRLTAHSQDLSPPDKQVFDRLHKIYADAKLEVPTLENAIVEATAGTKTNRQHARKIFQLLLDSKEIVRISDEFYFSNSIITDLIDKLREFAAKSIDKMIDVPTFKDIAGVSRKYAIPLLEYFDREKITRRAGDKRVIL